MFDQIMSDPMLLVLPSIVSTVFGFLLSRAVELYPPFYKWWDALDYDSKIAYRGWAGLLIAKVVVIFGHFSGAHRLSLNSTEEWLAIAFVILYSWLTFVGTSESTYNFTKKNSTRKSLQ